MLPTWECAGSVSTVVHAIVRHVGDINPYPCYVFLFLSAPVRSGGHVNRINALDLPQMSQPSKLPTLYVTISAMKSPTQKQVIALRKKHGLTQRQCAEMLHITVPGYQHYEYSARRMSAAAWDLFQIKCAALESVD